MKAMKIANQWRANLVRWCYEGEWCAHARWKNINGVSLTSVQEYNQLRSHYAMAIIQVDKLEREWIISEAERRLYVSIFLRWANRNWGVKSNNVDTG